MRLSGWKLRAMALCVDLVQLVLRIHLDGPDTARHFVTREDVSGHYTIDMRCLAGLDVVGY
jgi:hypothetical protein